MSNYFSNIIIRDLIVAGDENTNQIMITLKYDVLNSSITDTLEIKL